MVNGMLKKSILTLAILSQSVMAVENIYSEEFEKKIEELENAIRTLKQLCHRQGTLIKDLNKKADDLDRDAKAISKVTHYYGTRKQLKWWQKLI